MVNNMRKVAFLHIAIMGHYEEVNKEILDCFRDSGLLDELDFLHIGVVGDINKLNLPFEHEKFKIVHHGDYLGLFEYPTMQAMKDYCTTNDCYALYTANVGVSHDKNRVDYYPGWRLLDLDILIIKYKKCFQALDDGYDACSFEWQDDPCKHFSGNCFWTTSEYLKTLPDLSEAKEYGLKIINSPRHGAEFWIGMKPKIKHKSFFQTGYNWRSRPIINWYEEMLKREYTAV